MATMLALGTGLIAGSLHVVSGPDHLAALAPIAVRDRVQAMRVGATWGLGHGLGVCALGGLGLAFRQVVDITELSHWSEFIVGLLLIGIGIWAIRRATRMEVHAHRHSHGGDEHVHLHLHVDEHEHGQAHAHRAHSHAALGVGFVHGAAGAGHLFGVVPALALPTPDAAVYILAYLISAVCSMALFGGLLGHIAERSGTRWMRRLMVGSGAAALAIGVVWTWTSWPV
jgi:putative Mn2+ efflux pump MntP